MAGPSAGPLIDRAAVEKVERHVSDAVVRGARVMTGGGRPAIGGAFFEPTLLEGVTAGMAVAGEEAFGPLAPIFRFQDEQDVIVQANDTRSGLASYFHARDISRVWRVAEALECGIVRIHAGLISTRGCAIWWREGIGQRQRDLCYGIDDYLELEYLCLGSIGET